jgi:sodium transport system permease protein
MEALLITPVNRMKLIMAKWLTISTLGVISGGFSILAFGLITHLLTEKMASALQYEGQILSLLLSAMIGITLFSFMFATLQMMISIIAKTFKEAQNYLSPIMFLSLIPYFLLTGVVPNELTTLHFIIPFMNIYALLKELIYGIFSIQSILLVTGSSLVMVLIGFSLANWMFKKDKWVLGR